MPTPTQMLPSGLYSLLYLLLGRIWATSVRTCWSAALEEVSCPRVLAEAGGVGNAAPPHILRVGDA